MTILTDYFRSHAIITLFIETRRQASEESVEEKSVDEKGSVKNQLFLGKFNLIDLAGSERVTESKVEGHTLQEAQFINKSLLALGT